MFNYSYNKLRSTALMLMLCIVFTTSVYAVPTFAQDIQIADTNTSANISAQADVSKGEIPSLKEADIPETFDLSEMKAKGHIYRIKEQEQDANTVVFLNSDNTTTKYVFPQPIKYTDSNGVIHDKSTKLTADGTDLVMADNDINVVFPQNIAQGIAVKKEDKTISMSPNYTAASSRTTPQNSKSAGNNKVIYQNAFGDGIHLEYTALFSGVKEDIILDSYTGKKEFSFVIDTNGLYPVKNSNGSCSFYNPSTDEIEAEMMQVFCIDSANRFAGGDISITQVIANQKYIFTIIPDAYFLTDENTVYPVTIDPTITMNDEYAVEDTVLYSGKPTHNYGDHRYATVGYLDDTYKIGYYMVKFPRIATTAFYESNDVTSAYFHIYTASGGNASSVKTHAYKHPWDDDTITWNTFCALIAPTLISTNAVPTGGTQKLSIDITTAARGWKDENDNTYDPDYGLLITSANSSTFPARDFLTVEYATTHNNAYMPYLEINLATADTYILVTDYPTDAMHIGDHYICNAVFISNGVGIFGHNGTNFSFESSNPSVVAPNYGNLLALSAGSAVITVSCGDYSAYFTVNVAEDIVNISSSNYTINNDIGSGNTKTCNIEATLTRGDETYDEGETNAEGKLYIKYSKIETTMDPRIEGVDFDEIVTVDPITGVVRVTIDSNQDYYKAHATGTVKIKVSSEAGSGTPKTVTVTIKCNDLTNPSGSSTVPLVEGRHIRVDYPIATNTSNAPGELVAGNREVVGGMLDIVYGYDSVLEDINTNFTKEDGWWQYDDSQMGYNRRFFDLIRTSKVTFIITHGEAGAIYTNSNNSSYKITSEDILDLHQGYFNYCELIVVMSCHGATYPSDGNGELGYSIIEAFKERGAQCVIGFNCDVATEATEFFQKGFCEAISSSTNGTRINEAIDAGKQAMIRLYEEYVDNVVVEGDSDSYLE